MDEDKFQMKVREDYISIIDVETGRQLDLNNRWHVKQLINLLNDWHNILKNKWGFKKK